MGRDAPCAGVPAARVNAMTRSKRRRTLLDDLRAELRTPMRWRRVLDERARLYQMEVEQLRKDLASARAVLRRIARQLGTKNPNEIPVLIGALISQRDLAKRRSSRARVDPVDSGG